MLEHELKVLVPADAELSSLEHAVPGATLGPPEVRQIDDRYFDTADFRLARWGVTLRWREGTGWNLKLPAANGDAAALQRQELVLAGRPGEPPPAVVALVSGFTRNHPLVPVARVINERTARRWRTADGREVAELTDDRVTGTELAGGPEGQGPEVTFREVEVELLDGGDPSLLTSVGNCLPAVPGSCAMPKLIRLVGAPASAPPDVIVPSLPAKPSAGEVIVAVLASSVQRLLCHLPAVHLDTDPEAVHQARVATRRLRSDLKTFAPLLRADAVAGLRDELASLGTELGRVRDADVLRQHLSELLAVHPEISSDHAAAVLRRLDSQREADLAALTADLTGAPSLALLDRLVALPTASIVAADADKPAAEVITPLVAKAWRRLRRHVRAMDDQPTNEALHRTRILAKRVRYAAEAASPAVPHDAKRFARHAAKIQGLLGDQHDAVVAAAWLADQAGALRGRPAFAAGRMAQVCFQDADGLAEGWHRHYTWLKDHDNWLSVTVSSRPRRGGGAPGARSPSGGSRSRSATSGP